MLCLQLVLPSNGTKLFGIRFWKGHILQYSGCKICSLMPCLLWVRKSFLYPKIMSQGLSWIRIVTAKFQQKAFVTNWEYWLQKTAWLILKTKNLPLLIHSVFTINHSFNQLFITSPPTWEVSTKLLEYLCTCEHIFIIIYRHNYGLGLQ